MKNLKLVKNFNILTQGLLMIVLSSLLFSMATGISVWAFVVIFLLASLFISKPKNALHDGVYREMWTGQIAKYIENLSKAIFLAGLPDYSQSVATVGDENQAIHLASMDVLPDVLINNTTYPIPLQSLDVADVIITLDKYNTKRTPITDDELFALSVKKMDAVVERHGLAIAINKFKKAIHALAPGSGTAVMPVLLTTGADDGTGRKRLTWDDVVALKRALDNMDNVVPEEDRRLVLCSDHVNDLIVSDQRFQNQYYDRSSGKPYSQLGFEIMDYSGNPYFTPATKTKLSFGAIPAATDRKGSVFFAKSRTAIATGWTKMYYSIAAQHPDTQQNEVNFRHYFTALPTREAFRAAIVSNNV